MGIETAEAPYLADDSSGGEAPLLAKTPANSSHRRLSLRSQTLRRRKRHWRKRFLERLNALGSGGVSSAEEDLPGYRESQKLLADALLTARNNLRSSLTELNALALKRLPRPSEVVPDIEHPSASDAGLAKDEKKSYRRRCVCTGVKTRFLDRNGVQQSVPLRSREDRGLKRYTMFMEPPKEDWFIEQYRVPAPLLSRSYKGSLLAVKRIGKHRKNLNSASRIFVRGRLRELSVSESEHESVGEFEMWTTTSDSETPKALEEAAEAVQSASTLKLTAAERRQRENAEVLKQVLAENKSDSEKSSESSGPEGGGDDSVVPDKADRPIAVRVVKGGISSSAKPKLNPGGVLENSAAEEPDLLDQLSTMITENTKALFEPPPKPSTECNKPNTIDLEKIAEVERANETDMNVEPEGLSQFELDQRRDMIFCTGRGLGKRLRSGVHEEILKRESSNTKRKLVTSENFLPSKNRRELQKVDSSKASRMMKKMGFTGRLGAREDGALEPLIARKNRGRSGIGAKSTCDVALNEIDGSTDAVPSAFKGKTIEEVDVGPTSKPHTRDEDEFGRRKKTRQNETLQRRAACSAEEGVHSKVEFSDTGAVEGVANASERAGLDEEDEYETAGEDEAVDNGRRAVLLDFDVVMKNGQGRRMAAFRKMVAKAEILSQSLDIEDVLLSEEKDLSDVALIEQILTKNGVEATSETVDYLQDVLDDAFRTGIKAEWDDELMDCLKVCVGKVYFGFFHRGSRARMNNEWRTLAVERTVFNGQRVTVKEGDEWPYLQTWQDLLCKVGVRAHQALFVCCPTDRVDMLNGDLVAGAMLRARTMLPWKTNGELKLIISGLSAAAMEVELSANEVRNDAAAFLDRFLQTLMPQVGRRRVLAEYEAQWYSGVEVVGAKHSAARRLGKSLIRFHKYDNLKWVATEDIVGLERKNFRKLRDADFPGLIEPEDADIL